MAPKEERISGLCNKILSYIDQQFKPVADLGQFVFNGLIKSKDVHKRYENWVGGITR